jgi:hypothetical protein
MTEEAMGILNIIRLAEKEEAPFFVEMNARLGRISGEEVFFCVRKNA